VLLLLVYRKWSGMLKDLKNLVLYNIDTIKSLEGKVVYTLEINDDYINHVHSDILQIQRIFSKYKYNPDITFDKSYIKIEIK
jgi:hypothetical protein